METMREKMVRMLNENGISPPDAVEIMKSVEASSLAEPMCGRWDTQADSYPTSTHLIAWSTVRRVARMWLKAHKPLHFTLDVLS